MRTTVSVAQLVPSGDVPSPAWYRAGEVPWANVVIDLRHPDLDRALLLPAELSILDRLSEPWYARLGEVEVETYFQHVLGAVPVECVSDPDHLLEVTSRFVYPDGYVGAVIGHGDSLRSTSVLPQITGSRAPGPSADEVQEHRVQVLRGAFENPFTFDGPTPNPVFMIRVMALGVPTSAIWSRSGAWRIDAAQHAGFRFTNPAHTSYLLDSVPTSRCLLDSVGSDEDAAVLKMLYDHRWPPRTVLPLLSAMRQTGESPTVEAVREELDRWHQVLNDSALAACCVTAGLTVDDVRRLISDGTFNATAVHLLAGLNNPSPTSPMR